MNDGYELYNAVKEGKIEKIRALINNGVDVNYVFKPEEYGYTPLHIAAYYAMNETIELLVNNGADINCYSLNGKTPLDFAVERHNRKETVALLLYYGAEKGTYSKDDAKTFLTDEDEKLKIEVIKELEEGKWVDADKVHRAFGLSFKEAFARFDFSRTAEWWSVVGKTEEERARNGQKICTCFRLKHGKTVENSLFPAEHSSDENEDKRKTIAEEKGIVDKIDTTEHPAFKLALVTDEIAVYVNSGDDVLTMDLGSKTIMDEVAGVKKYHETMEKIINQGKGYEYGEKLVSYCKRNRLFESKQPENAEEEKTISMGNFQHRRRGR